MYRKKTSYSWTIILPVVFIFHSCIPHSVVHRKPEGYTGEWDRDFEWKSSDKTIKPSQEQWKAMQDTFNRVPAKLDLVNRYFDSTLPLQQCYKFIYSPDSTQFIALYMAGVGSPEHKVMKKSGGSNIIHSDYTSKDPEFYGEPLLGMLYNNRWYYTKDHGHYFRDPDLNAAKRDFLYYYLSDEWFFEDWLTSQHGFWNTGGKSIWYLPVRVENYLRTYPDYEGMPVLVAQGNVYLREMRRANDKWLIQNIELIRQQDTSLYHTINKKSISADIISFYMDKAITSFEFTDAAGKMWFGFVYLEMENETTVKRAYFWNSPIDRVKLNEGVQLIKYYEQFIPGWNFGKQLLKETDFWERSVTKTADGHYLYLKEFFAKP